MADNLYKLGEPIEIGYQAPNAESDLVVKADIYKPDKTLYSLGNLLIEIPNTGTYRGVFTPIEEGTWQVVMYVEVDSFTTDGQITKAYSVGKHNIHSIGEMVSRLDTPPMAF